MDTGRKTPESREEALERILAETASGKYEKRIVRRNPPVKKPIERQAENLTEAEKAAAAKERAAKKMAEMSRMRELQRRENAGIAQRPEGVSERPAAAVRQPKSSEASRRQEYPGANRTPRPPEQPKAASRQSKPSEAPRRQEYPGADRTPRPPEQPKAAARPPETAQKKEMFEKTIVLRKGDSLKSEIETAFGPKPEPKDMAEYDPDYENEISTDNEIETETDSSHGEYAVKSYRKQSVLGDILDVAECVIIAAFLVFMIFTYLLRTAAVQGTSMEPTLKENDKLLITALGYTPKMGDVVVIDDRDAVLISDSGETLEKAGLGKSIVKRIIATEGQTVDINFDTGDITVDGAMLNEPYISEDTHRDEYAFEYPVKVPEGCVFVLGDNRNLSKDSRHPDVGMVPEEDIIGKVILRIYPFGSFGKV